MVKSKTKIIIKYLEGRLSPKEKTLFEEEMEESVDFREEVEKISFIWRNSAELKFYKQIDVQRNWKEVSGRIKKEKFKLTFFQFIRSAAAILLLPVLFLAGNLYSRLDHLNNQTVSMLEVTSAKGTVSKTILPDGTEVWLNSESKLSYPQKFIGDRRTVHLSGEAYFKVKSDKSHRFDVVVVNELVVSAYGTEFNINAFQQDTVADVTLVKGNIDVSDIGYKTTKGVLPGQYIAYNRNGKDMVLSKANLEEKTGWRDGKIIFRRANMQEVTRRLSRYFNVDIQLDGEELRNYEYSATFTTETLSEILQLLEKTAPIKYKIIEPKQSTDYSFSKKKVIIGLKKRGSKS